MPEPDPPSREQLLGMSKLEYDAARRNFDRRLRKQSTEALERRAREVLDARHVRLRQEHQP